MKEVIFRIGDNLNYISTHITCFKRDDDRKNLIIYTIDGTTHYNIFKSEKDCDKAYNILHSVLNAAIGTDAGSPSIKIKI